MQFLMGDTEDLFEMYEPILKVHDPDSSELLKEVETKILQNVPHEAAKKRKSRLQEIFKRGKRSFDHEAAYYAELCSGGNFQVIIS